VSGFGEEAPKAEAHREAAVVLPQAVFAAEIPNALRQEADRERKFQFRD